MPYRTEWVPPEVFLEHNGVTVYRTYKDDEIDSPLEYWYTLSDDYDGAAFDVRELPQYNFAEDHKDILKRAIDAGHF